MHTVHKAQALNSRQDVIGGPVDVVPLKGAKPCVKEWYEGFEELRAIPHSFALALGNSESTMMFFSDTSDEKVRSSV